MPLANDQYHAIASIYYNSPFIAHIAGSVARARDAVANGRSYVLQESLRPVCSCWGSVRMNVQDMQRVLLCGPSTEPEGIWYSFHQHRNTYLRIIAGFTYAKQAFVDRKDYSLFVTLPADTYSLTSGNSFRIDRDDFISIMRMITNIGNGETGNTYDLPTPQLFSITICAEPGEYIGYLSPLSYMTYGTTPV